MARWAIEATTTSGDWQRIKREFPSVRSAAEASCKAFILQASRGLHKGFAIRLVRIEKKQG